MYFSFEPFNIIMVTAALLIATIAGYPIWVRLRIKNAPQQRRQADRAPLTRKEKQIFEKAKQLFFKKEIVAAAQLLETISRQREAVQMLEEGGHIDEAASMLKRMQRPNRAGVMYARHAIWEKAADCFKLANMPLEVARCEREQGEFKTAAEYFLQCEHFAEAAECFNEAGDLRNAARNYIKSGYDRKASDLYVKMLESNSGKVTDAFTDVELQFFTDQLSRGNSSIWYAKALDSAQKLHDSLFNLLRYGNFADVARYLSSATNDYTEKLNGMVSGHDYAAQNLVKAYDINGSFVASAKLYEMRSEYALAAARYTRANLSADAKRCKAIAIEIDKAKNEESPSFPESNPAEETAIIDTSEKDSGSTQVKLSDAKREQYASLARKISLFSDLSLDERLLIISGSNEQTFSDGDVIDRENSTSKGFMILMSGEIRVIRSTSDAADQREKLSTGEAFGEGWVFFDELPSATYKAKGKCTILEIAKEELITLLDKNPTLSRRLYKSLLRQWRMAIITSRKHREISEAS